MPRFIGLVVFGRISQEALRNQAKRTHFDVRISITENQLYSYWPQTLEPVVQTKRTTTPVKQVV
jgi:hypothetical protein